MHEANGRKEKPIAVKKADVEASDSERLKYQRHNEAPSDGIEFKKKPLRDVVL